MAVLADGNHIGRLALGSRVILPFNPSPLGEQRLNNLTTLASLINGGHLNKHTEKSSELTSTSRPFIQNNSPARLFILRGIPYLDILIK